MSSPVVWADARARIIAGFPGVLIAWPNEPLPRDPGAEVWLSVQATSNRLHPIELGADVWQEEGTIYVDVHVMTNSGTDAARATAKQVADLFRAVAGSSIVYLESNLGNGSAADPDGIWWTMTVAVDYRYQDIAS
jgi:hypothetical protein